MTTHSLWLYQHQCVGLEQLYPNRDPVESFVVVYGQY